MRLKRITRAISVVMLLALLIGIFPMAAFNSGAAAAEIAAATAPADAAETSAPEEAADETRPDDPFQDPQYLLDETAKFLKDYDLLGNGSGLRPQGANSGTMSLEGKFYIYDIGGDSIKRMTYNGNLYKVYCLMRTKLSGNNVPFTSDTSTWGLGNYAPDKRAAIGKLLAIANTMIPNPTYCDELAIQLLVWELAEKTTAGPYTIAGTYLGYLDKTWGFESYANGSWTPANQELDNLPAAKQHYNSIAAAFNATNNAPNLPSFASASQGSAQTYELTYNSTTHQYETTLTDNNHVLANYTVTCDNPDVSITVNGNSVTISASDPDVFNDAELRTVGNTYEYTYSNSSYIGFVPDDSTTYQSCVTMKDNLVLSFRTGYLKIRASYFSVSLKKTANASANTLACIQDNPLYTLQGAVYEIHLGSDTGPVTETLTTDINGDATGTQRYPIGTTLYAVETAAPSGYLLNTTSAALTVSAGTNELQVTDTPAFDPNVLEIKKTGSTSGYIEGTVFKAEFYAWTWAKSDKLLRTWYLKSDANGYLFFDDAHLLPSYNGESSDLLFKPNGSNNRPSFPLGCVVITEVQAAEGYILPSGNNGKVYIFITQNESGGSAEAYWGDGGGNPLTSVNPRGIYTVENDADPSALTAVNDEAYGSPFSLQKTDPNGVPLEGAVFQVDYYNSSWFDSTKLEKTWFFQTDAAGYFTLEDQYLAAGYASDELFAVDAIPVGIMRVKELEPPEGYALSTITGIWRIKQTESGSSTVSSYWAAANGDTPTTSYGDTAYVYDADPDTLYITDALLPGMMTMSKVLPEGVSGSTEGYAFRLYRYNDPEAGITSATWYGKSDASGDVYQTNSSFDEPAGAKNYTFTGLVDGTYAFREVLSLRESLDIRTARVCITTLGGVTPAVTLVYEGDDLSWEENGDCTIGGINLTGLNGGGTLTIEITNAPLAIEVHKSFAAGQTGDPEGWEFKIYNVDPDEDIYAVPIYTIVTDSSGIARLNGIPEGTYWLKETSVAGWQILPSQEFEVTGSSTAVDPLVIDVVNHIAIAAVELKKAFAEGSSGPLNGWEFALLPIEQKTFDGSIFGITSAIYTEDLSDGEVGGYLVFRASNLTDDSFAGIYKVYRNGTQCDAIDGAPGQFRVKKPLASGDLLTVVYRRNVGVGPTDYTVAVTDSNGKAEAEVLIGTYYYEEIPRPGYLQQPGGTITAEEKFCDVYVTIGDIDELDYANKRYRVGEVFSITMDPKYNNPRYKLYYAIEDDAASIGYGLYQSPRYSQRTFAFKITEEMAQIGKIIIEPNMWFPDRAVVTVFEARSLKPNTMVFGVVLVIPESATRLNRTRILRCRDDHHEITTLEELLAAPNLRTYVTNYNKDVTTYINRYTATSMTAGSSQTIIAEFTYTQNGTQYVVYSDLMHIDIPAEDVNLNEREPSGSITVEKSDRAGNKIANVGLRLEYSYDGGTTWNAIRTKTAAEQANQLNPYPVGTCSSVGLTSGGVLTTGSTGRVTFSGLHAGNGILYRVVEASVPPGLSLLAEPVFIGEIPEQRSFDSAAALNQYLSQLPSADDAVADLDTLTVTLYHRYAELVNTGTFSMPMTGGAGFGFLPYVAGLTMLAVLILATNRRMKKRKE